MAKISKTSSINKKRIHNSFVDRSRIVRKTEGVDAVNPIDPIKNDINYSSSNHLMTSDLLYDNLEQLRDEYKKFYHDERNLEKAIKNLQNNKDELANNMNELIEKYNKAILSLEKFDKKLNTAHTMKIKNILIDFKDELKNIGINIVRNKELEIVKEKFVKEITKSDNSITFLFQPIRGMIIRLYKAFRSIKAPENKFDSEYNNATEGRYSGILMDNRY